MRRACAEPSQNPYVPKVPTESARSEEAITHSAFFKGRLQFSSFVFQAVFRGIGMVLFLFVARLALLLWFRYVGISRFCKTASRS
jgi:hypothetical protein